MSARKNNLRLFQNITAGDMSQATVTSTITSIQWLDNVGIQLSWTGSPVGDFTVEVSADHAQDELGNVTNTGSWIPVVLSYLVAGVMVQLAYIPSSVGSPIYVDLTQISAPWIRVKYTKTSGTGTLTGYITAKQV